MKSGQGERRGVAEGKIGYSAFRLLSNSFGARRGDILLGPRFGADFGVVSLKGGIVMAVSTDPLYLNTKMALRDSAWFAFHIAVADVALSGIPPSFMVLDWNLPPDFSDSDLRTVSGVFGRESSKCGISVLTGHTGRYEGCRLPIAGAATCIAYGDAGRLILPVSSRPGDVLIAAGTPALETAFLLSYELEDLISSAAGHSFIKGIRKRMTELSVIDKVRVLSGTKGITAMHDVSERGFYGAVHEMSIASGKRFSLRSSSLHIDSAVARLSSLLGFDPLESSSEGMVLITARSSAASSVLGELERNHIPCSVCGKVERGRPLVTDDASGVKRRISYPTEDGFLSALANCRKSAKLGDSPLAL
ncbi:MAG: hypothetical protein KIY12_06100 [Thermoplasmata archaeon]|uniref:AIR synthase n=1 Tax=Candidatus Sysuiplasma superficiale TaxID=2823368 RepID=A0A8J7YP24_9ARCH|nr:hypothetical protein [Candidatus Sysuiplasma superficiale]MBX8644278.1 hypothetical protein [Candidatus Sysuiplasma superficiale]MCL4347111.1 AIR synthase-related protein [Candidatus Thermoplasmatota archaeon]